MDRRVGIVGTGNVGGGVARDVFECAVRAGWADLDDAALLKLLSGTG